MGYLSPRCCSPFNCERDRIMSLLDYGTNLYTLLLILLTMVWNYFIDDIFPSGTSNSRTGPGEMDQSVKCLLHKNKNLRITSSHENLGMVACDFNQGAEEVDSWGFLVSWFGRITESWVQ